MAKTFQCKFVVKYLKSLDWKIIAFLGILVLAIFLRTYNFSEWLFFKMDQARDASNVKLAFDQGPGWLPLLGPKAGGTELNLGPMFYYFQYAAAVLFQSTHPAVLAFPDLIFGILSVPLFYLFTKKYFSRNWSLVLTGLFAVNFLGIQYSRFAWNPNSLPFFNLLYFYALLNAFDKKIKYRLRWFIIAGAAFAVSTQLHFLSFLTLPVITFVFIAHNRKNIGKYLDWKKAAVFVFVVLILYLPFFLNEHLSRGENTHQFFRALKEKPSDHSLWQNINRNIRYWGQNWFLILTGWISHKGGTNGSTLVWLGAILPGLFLAVKKWWAEKESMKKNFLTVILLWFIIYFFTYIPVAYQIRPRFFLPLLGLPIVLVDILAHFFWQLSHRFWKIAAVTGLIVVFFGNLTGTFFWFQEMRASQRGPVDPWRTIILKAKDGIVLWHLEEAAKFMKENCFSEKIYYDVSNEYEKPVKYVLDELKLEANDVKKLARGVDDSCVFNLGLARAGKLKLNKTLKEEFGVSNNHQIGALIVYKLKLNGEFQGRDLPSFSPSTPEEEKTKRLYRNNL